MSLEAYLRDLGLGEVHKRPVKHGGKDVVLHARELSADEVEALFDGLRGESGEVLPEKQRELRNRVVSASICDEHGRPQLSVEEVGGMPHRLLGPLVDFALEVNGMSAPSEGAEKKGQPGG